MDKTNTSPAKQAFSVDDIDEAMVERVYQRAKRLGVLVRPDLKAEIAMMLESALTPPTPDEPEILTTPRMHAAGESAWRLWVAEAPEETWPSCIARVYTAMERERLREAAEGGPCNDRDHAHGTRRFDSWLPGRIYRGHRRKDDP